MEGQIAVKVVRSHEEIQEIAYVWRSWQCHPNSDLDFYLTVLRSKPEFLRPHVIVVYRDQCPEALLVGRLELRQVEARVGYARLLKMKTRALTFLYGGVLGTLSPEGSEALVNDIVNSLSQGEADLAYFNHLRADSPLYRAASKVSGLLRRDHFSHQQIHRAMIVPESPAKFYSQLSTKARKNLKWQAKKLTQEFPGKVEVRCFREKGDLERMFQDVETIARKTYQRGLGVGFVDSPEMRRRLAIEADKGWVRAYVLYVQNTPWAFWIGNLYDGTFHSDFMGYDPNLRKHSPGMFLLVKVIEDFCNRRGCGEQVSKIDFGLGDAQYKEVLGNLEWNDASLYIFSVGARGVAVNLLRTPFIFLERTARKALGLMRPLDRMKRKWRERLAIG